jgi:hypothetical protein
MGPQQPLPEVPAGAFQVVHDNVFFDPYSNSAFAFYVLLRPGRPPQSADAGVYIHYATGQALPYEMVCPIEALPHSEWVQLRDSRGWPIPVELFYAGPNRMYGLWVPPERR